MNIGSIWSTLKPNPGGLQKFLNGLKWYLVLSGFVTFSLFIMEESIQTSMFGTWPAKSARAWGTYKTGIDLIQKINFMLKVVTYGAGWIQPLAFISYKLYAEATDVYIEGCMAEIMANEPELYVDQKVRVTLVTKKVESIDDGYLAIGGRVAVLVQDIPDIGRDLKASGILRKRGNYLVIE